MARIYVIITGLKYTGCQRVRVGGDKLSTVGSLWDGLFCIQFTREFVIFGCLEKTNKIQRGLRVLASFQIILHAACVYFVAAVYIVSNKR